MHACFSSVAFASFVSLVWHLTRSSFTHRFSRRGHDSTVGLSSHLSGFEAQCSTTHVQLEALSTFLDLRTCADASSTSSATAPAARTRSETRTRAQHWQRESRRLVDQGSSTRLATCFVLSILHQPPLAILSVLALFINSSVARLIHAWPLSTLLSCQCLAFSPFSIPRLLLPVILALPTPLVPSLHKLSTLSFLRACLVSTLFLFLAFRFVHPVCWLQFCPSLSTFQMAIPTVCLVMEGEMGRFTDGKGLQAKPTCTCGVDDGGSTIRLTIATKRDMPTHTCGWDPSRCRGYIPCHLVMSLSPISHRERLHKNFPN